MSVTQMQVLHLPKSHNCSILKDMQRPVKKHKNPVLVSSSIAPPREQDIQKQKQNIMSKRRRKSNSIRHENSWRHWSNASRTPTFMRLFRLLLCLGIDLEVVIINIWLLTRKSTILETCTTWVTIAKHKRTILGYFTTMSQPIKVDFFKLCQYIFGCWVGQVASAALCCW